MDKGYDSEAIHRLIREDLHADTIIPIRSWNNEFVGGIYRQEMALHFDDIRYRKRQLVENMFSVFKRKFSGDLTARIFSIQMKEIPGNMIVCNLHRFLQFLINEVFYRAERLSLFSQVWFEGYFTINSLKLIFNTKSFIWVLLDPNNAGIWYNKGLALHRLGSSSEAWHDFDISRLHDPNLADAWYNKSNKDNSHCEKNTSDSDS